MYRYVCVLHKKSAFIIQSAFHVCLEDLKTASGCVYSKALIYAEGSPMVSGERVRACL